MPFTASHIAAVLPLIARPGARSGGRSGGRTGRFALVPAALVIGSMAPDLPYYVPSPFDSGLMHEPLRGVLGADVLLGLAVFAVWQSLIAPAAVLLAPAAVRRRLHPDAGSGLRRYLRPAALAMTVVSLAVGAATHVLWDGFTHDGHWASEHVPWLAEVHGPYSGAQWAQLGCSVLGLVAVAVDLGLRWHRAAPAAVEPAVAHGRRLPGLRLRAVAAGAVLGAALTGAGYAGGRALFGGRGGHSLVWHVLTGGGSAAVAAALAVAVTTLLLSAQRRSPAAVR